MKNQLLIDLIEQQKSNDIECKKAKKRFNNMQEHFNKILSDYESRLNVTAEELEKTLSKRAGAAEQIEKELKSVDDPITIKAIRYKYINCYSWSETADLLGYSPRFLQNKIKSL